MREHFYLGEIYLPGRRISQEKPSALGGCRGVGLYFIGPATRRTGVRGEYRGIVAHREAS